MPECTPVLALDFDGVICNSQSEVEATALEAYLELCPESHFASLDQNRRVWMTEEFQQLTPLGNRAEDFGVALRALEQHLVIRDQVTYDAFFEKQDRDWLDDYHSEFYRVRNERRHNDLRSWLQLHSVYPPIVEYLKSLSDVVLAIATSKDAASVRLLLDHFQIADLFPERRLFDKECGPDKTHHLTLLAHDLGAPFSAITFIDDKLRHLCAVRQLGVDTALATWGFNTEREHEQAREQGFRLAYLDRPATILGISA